MTINSPTIPVNQFITLFTIPNSWSLTTRSASLFGCVNLLRILIAFLNSAHSSPPVSSSYSPPHNFSAKRETVNTKLGSTLINFFLIQRRWVKSSNSIIDIIARLQVSSKTALRILTSNTDIWFHFHHITQLQARII